MKLPITFLLTLFTLTAWCQPTGSVEPPSNSFEGYYKKSKPALKYRYDPASQTHDYSNNWDLDKDGINDEVYFTGTGGAHLYYVLKVVLSTDHTSRVFDFIQSDFPLLTASDTLDFNKTASGFVVTDFGKKMSPVIIVRLDEQTFRNNKELKKRKIKTKNVLVRFENGNTMFGSL